MPQATFQDYGYANARVRAMGSALLGRDFYERLIEEEDVSRAIDALKDTAYREDIEHTTLEVKNATSVEEAFKRNLARNFRKIQTFVSKRAGELLSLLLARWDLFNIKTVLRGKHIKIDDEEIIASFVPAGELDELLLLELVKQPTVKACVDFLATWGIEYAKPLTTVIPIYAKDKNLMVLETALDRYYFEHALKRLKGMSMNVALTREIIISTIDVTNIMTLLRVQDVNFHGKAEEIKEDQKELGKAGIEKARTEVQKETGAKIVPEEESEKEERPQPKELKVPTKKLPVFDKKTGKRIVEEEEEEGEPVEEIEERLILSFFIPGGREVNKDKFLTLARYSEPSDVIAGLSESAYGKILQAAELGYLEKGRVSILERRLEQFLVNKAVSMYKIDLLSIGVIIGYIWSKFNEVVNLRVIIRGKSVGMPMENIKEELVLV